MRRTVEQKRARMESNMANTANQTEVFLNIAELKQSVESYQNRLQQTEINSTKNYKNKSDE